MTGMLPGASNYSDEVSVSLPSHSLHMYRKPFMLFLYHFIIFQSRSVAPRTAARARCRQAAARPTTGGCLYKTILIKSRFHYPATLYTCVGSHLCCFYTTSSFSNHASLARAEPPPTPGRTLYNDWCIKLFWWSLSFTTQPLSTHV
jgi:hypothetical protein